MWIWSGNTGAESPIPDPVSLQANSHLLCHFINDKHRLQNSCIFLNKNSFLCTKHAQSMQAISLTSLPSLAFYSFTMFTSLKINILSFLAPVSLFFCFSIEKQNKLVRSLLFTPTYNVKLLWLPEALNIALCMCPKVRHYYDITV